MADIVGGITTSHIPAIGNAIAKGLQQTPYWKPFFDGYVPVRRWLDEVRPDVAIVIYNDHGLNFFLDQIPTFAIGAAERYANEDEGWGLNVLPPVRGNPELSWHLIDSLIGEEFDLTMCQEMTVDHGCMVPLLTMWPETTGEWPVAVVPIAVNTVQHPVPSARRCYKLGQALGRALESYPENLQVVVFGTGGMSHQLQGERAGFINTTFDMTFMRALVDDPEALADLTTAELVEQAGSEGIELIMWLAMRGAMTHGAALRHSHYHVPVSNTAAGVLLVENVPAQVGQPGRIETLDAATRLERVEAK
jgi:protocatechuate 4,5-dioxygenase, beta chain